MRITPARAGKRDLLKHKKRGWQDHPRTRGEKNVSTFWKQVVEGSPPHARGKVVLIRFIHRDGGITPARAGKSDAKQGKHPLFQDHPRTRGEKPELRDIFKRK